MRKKELIRICPKCGSKEVTVRGMISRHAYSQNYICLTCGFQSPLFPKVSREEAEKLLDKPRKFVPSRLPIFADKYEKPGKSKLAIIIGFIIMIFLLLLLLLFG